MGLGSRNKMRTEPRVGGKGSVDLPNESTSKYFQKPPTRCYLLSTRPKQSSRNPSEIGIPHFIDHGTEAHSCEITCPSSHR